MQIRQLTAADADRFKEIRLRAMKEHPTAFWGSVEEESVYSSEQVAQFLIYSVEQVVLGAFDEGKLVGTIGIHRETLLKKRHMAMITRMYVAASHRAHGLGSALVREALAVARSWPGVVQVTLTVNAENQPAIAMYQREGFVEYGRLPRSICIDGVYHDDLFMVHTKLASSL